MPEARAPGGIGVIRGESVGPTRSTAQVTGLAALPEGRHQHPDEEEVRGSGPGSPTMSLAWTLKLRE